MTRRCLYVHPKWTYRGIYTTALILALFAICPAQTDTVRLGLDGVRLPVDTLVVGDRKIVGVAVPARVRQVPGDINSDGNVTLADVLTLAYHVLMARPLPGGDTVCIPIERTDALGVTTLFNFLPRRPGVR